MAPKYTILKVLIQNLSKVDRQSKGFTLPELIIGLLIMLIIGGLAMNAFVQASISFNKDQRGINSSQNLSAILEVIGSDIRQSGENINDANFPAIEFDANTEPSSMANSSKITIRRALTSRLTLCQNGLTPTTTSIIVADNLRTTVDATGGAGGANCDVGTSSSPLSIYRVPPTAATPTTYYPTSPVTALPTTPTPLALKLPLALRKVRDYRCQLDNLNPTTAYDLPANAGTDFCDGVAAETLRIAVSSSDGQLLIFNQTGEVANATADTSVQATTDTTSTKRYSITVNNTFNAGDTAAVPPVPPDSAIANNTKNSAATVTYNIGDPIYVIEERVYTLANDGSFRVSVNGAPPQTLIKKIANFRVSARTYNDATNRVLEPNPAANVCTVPTGTTFAAQPTASEVSISNPKYICKFNYFAGVTAADKASWKTLAGVKVELQAKYDSTGQSATASAADLEKLAASAEFFPRNVLSK